ncbi:MAG TPA: histidine kinase [Acidimicrobiales bacterium]|nr:histidine kinase [Acidimicrobiales bacterium]
MASSSRHLYPEWLHTERLRSRRARAGADPGRAHDRRDDGPWRLWAWLRAFDRRNATLVDLGLALALFVLCSGWVVKHHALRPSLWFVAALTFPLVFRRRAPMTVFLVIAAVAFVQWLVTGPGLADVALLVALYTVAVESEWPVVSAAVVVLEAGVVMATLRWEPELNNVQAIVFLTGLVFTALLAGVVVRALRSQLDWLAERAGRLEVERDQQASLAAAAERARIAREMHDVVSHNIQVMVTLADAASLARTSDPDRAAEAVHEVSSTGRQALTDMRRMLGVLRDEAEPVPGDSTAVSGNGSGSGRTRYAPQPGLGELPALVDRVRGTGLDVSVRHVGVPFEVSGAAGLTVYRVVQEALTNALKHAEEAHAVEVELAFADPDVAVRVTDDGRSAVAVPAGASGGGHGLAGMAERATAFGGTLTAGPRPTGGWEVEAMLHDCKAPAPA